MRSGQRVEATLIGPMRFDAIVACPFPTLAVRDAKPSAWPTRPAELAAAFEPDVREALRELGPGEATVTLDGTVIQVSGIDRDRASGLEESLRGRYGIFMVVGDDATVHVWPAVE